MERARWEGRASRLLQQPRASAGIRRSAKQAQNQSPRTPWTITLGESRLRGRLFHKTSSALTGTFLRAGSKRRQVIARLEAVGLSE